MGSFPDFLRQSLASTRQGFPHSLIPNNVWQDKGVTGSLSGSTLSQHHKNKKPRGAA